MTTTNDIDPENGRDPQDVEERGAALTSTDARDLGYWQKLRNAEERAADARAVADRVSRLRPVARRRAQAVAADLEAEAAEVRSWAGEPDVPPVLDPDDSEFWADPIGRRRRDVRAAEDLRIERLAGAHDAADRAHDRSRLDTARARWWRRGERDRAQAGERVTAAAAEKARVQYVLALEDQVQGDREAREEYDSAGVQQTYEQWYQELGGGGGLGQPPRDLPAHQLITRDGYLAAHMRRFEELEEKLAAWESGEDLRFEQQVADAEAERGADHDELGF